MSGSADRYDSYFRSAIRKLSRNRLRGHVPQQYLPNSVMDQNQTSGQLPEATSTGRAFPVNLKRLSRESAFSGLDSNIC
jgi:hypothetical protein